MPIERAEEARAAWLERFPRGFEERALGEELELAAYVERAEPDLHAEEVADDWADRWREFHHSVFAGSFWIGPPWETPPRDVQALVIDPGRAFGTGAHATTRLCVELVGELEPSSFLDIGCGSGVVAIAAARRGFTPVLAGDVDPAAIDATRRNAAANRVSVRALLLDGTRDVLPSAEIIAANVSLDVVEALLPRSNSRLVVASGYLAHEGPRAAGFRLVERRVLDGWAADLLERAE